MGQRKRASSVTPSLVLSGDVAQQCLGSMHKALGKSLTLKKKTGVMASVCNPSIQKVVAGW